jgi:hypothetical protein
VDLFSRWRHGKDFDVPSLRIPRLYGEGAVTIEDVRPLSPFMMMLDGEPTAIVRLDGLPEAEVAGLAKAVRDDRCLLAAGYKLYSTYPILIFSVFIYDDSPNGSFTVEGYRDVASADIQDFVAGLGGSGGRGRVLLYTGDPPGLVGSGKFALRIPPLIAPVGFPCQVSRRDLKRLWLMFRIVGQQRSRIPEEDLNFRAAIATHLKREPNMSARSTFDASGVVSASSPDFLG